MRLTFNLSYFKNKKEKKLSFISSAAKDKKCNTIYMTQFQRLFGKFLFQFLKV